jgi:hypothetical protein
LAAPNRHKYPEDYDSTSDYEVRKLGDVMKQIDLLKRSLEETHRNVKDNA